MNETGVKFSWRWISGAPSCIDWQCVTDTQPLPTLPDEQRITVNKSTHEIRYENETEKSVDVVIKPRG